jgi:acetyltransferase
MQLMLDYGREENLCRITGQVLRENRTMLNMCRELGFTIEDIEGVSQVKAVTLDFLASDSPDKVL